MMMLSTKRCFKVAWRNTYVAPSIDLTKLEVFFSKMDLGRAAGELYRSTFGLTVAIVNLERRRKTSEHVTRLMTWV